MSRDEALLQAIEKDLPHYHRQRMAERMGEHSAQLRDELSKPEPDPKRISALKAAMVQTERDKRDISITEREVLVPLREKLAQERRQGGTG